MPCVVPTCDGTIGDFRIFPQHTSLAERWLEAIRIGCGIEATNACLDLSINRICQRHFDPSQDSEHYQEPKLFFNCNEKQDVHIDSCRLCLRFFQTSDMFSINSQLSGKELQSIVSELLSIDLQSSGTPELVCIECLVRLDLLISMRAYFKDSQIKYHNLASLAKGYAKESCEPVEMSLSVEVIERDDPESHDVLFEEYCDFESGNTYQANGTSKSEPNSCDQLGDTEIASDDIKSRKCFICLVVLKDANQLSSHLTANHSRSESYRCRDCSFDFSVLSTYNEHLSQHDQTDKLHKCSFCAMSFKNAKSKILHEKSLHCSKHLKRSATEQSKPSICETCGESFMFLSKLRSHVRRKHRFKDKPTCTLCGRSFTTQSSLQRHMLLHTNEKPYACSNCDASYRRPLDLRYHVQKVHEGRNPHVCGECKQEFRTYISLYYHKQVVHLNKPKPHLKYSYNRKQTKPSNRKRSCTRPYQYKCKLCSELFSKNSDLKTHISATHINESYPVLECPQCPRTFVTIHSLCMHKATHTDKCICKECDKRFASFQALKNHIASIHEQKQFNCPICLSKTYKSQSALQQHMTLHTKGKQFPCEFCDKCFNRKTQLTIHRRLHTGEKPFQCPKCSKRFSDDGTFCKHKKRCLAVVVNNSIDGEINS